MKTPQPPTTTIMSPSILKTGKLYVLLLDVIFNNAHNLKSWDLYPAGSVLIYLGQRPEFSYPDEADAHHFLSPSGIVITRLFHAKVLYLSEGYYKNWFKPVS